MRTPDQDRDTVRDRIDSLERKVDFLSRLVPPAAAFVAGWVAYQVMIRALGQQEHEAYIVGLFVFAGVWFWLFYRLGKMR